jgi:hypothetical protein
VKGKNIVKKTEPSRMKQMPDKPKIPPNHDAMATMEQLPVLNMSEFIEMQGFPKSDEEVSRVPTRTDIADSDSKSDDTPPGVTEERGTQS